MTIEYREVSKEISLEERDKYWRRSEIYHHWLLEKIFKAQSEDSISVMVFPIEEGKPNYRDGDIPYVPFLMCVTFSLLINRPETDQCQFSAASPH